MKIEFQILKIILVIENRSYYSANKSSKATKRYILSRGKRKCQRGRNKFSKVYVMIMHIALTLVLDFINRIGHAGGRKESLTHL